MIIHWLVSKHRFPLLLIGLSCAVWVPHWKHSEKNIKQYIYEPCSDREGFNASLWFIIQSKTPHNHGSIKSILSNNQISHDVSTYDMQKIFRITKCFGPCQSLWTAQTDVGRYFSQMQSLFFTEHGSYELLNMDNAKLEALERLYRSTGLIFLQWQKFLTIIIQSLHFSSLKKKGMEKTCEKRRKKW